MRKRWEMGHWLLLGLITFATTLTIVLTIRLAPELVDQGDFDPYLAIVPAEDLIALPTATRFDFPLGSEHGAMAYNAQRFTENLHLGDDLNGIGGENSDLGDPIFAIADGRVLLAREAGPGWGNVIIVLHAYLENGKRKYLQSFYGHVQTILVAPHQAVRRGQQIATIGSANGRYLAHLHFEMREFVTPFIGAGYRKDTHGWLDPTAFIRSHRGAPDDDIGRSLMSVTSPSPDASSAFP
jgi:hypothetical protein